MLQEQNQRNGHGGISVGRGKGGIGATFLKPLKQAAASLGSQLGLSWAPTSPAEVAAICGSLCSSCWVALDRTQVAADLGLHLLGGRRASAPVGQLQTTSKHHPTTFRSDLLKGQTQ